MGPVGELEGGLFTGVSRDGRKRALGYERLSMGAL